MITVAIFIRVMEIKNNNNNNNNKTICIGLFITNFLNFGSSCILCNHILLNLPVRVTYHKTHVDTIIILCVIL